MLSKKEGYTSVQVNDYQSLNQMPNGLPNQPFGEMPPSLPKPQFNTYESEPEYEYKIYSSPPSPPGYHRYQSNTCNPKQDQLPITFPDPNEGVPPFEYDPLIMDLKYGSMPCGACNKLNYCQ